MRDEEIERKPMTEEEIQAANLGHAPRLDRRIVLAEYDPDWPRRYRQEAAVIRSALHEAVRGLQHVGSTSVPGLPAKPVIDVLLTVADSADEASYVPALEAAGYTLAIREPDWYEHRVLKKQGGDVDVAVNLHVFTLGCPETDRMLLFRDRLRADDADRELYARTKRELAGRDWTYVQQYADEKTTVVEQILDRARRG